MPCMGFVRFFGGNHKKTWQNPIFVGDCWWLILTIIKNLAKSKNKMDFLIMKLGIYHGSYPLVMKHCWNSPIDSGVRFLGDKPLEFLRDFVRHLYIQMKMTRIYIVCVYIYTYWIYVFFHEFVFGYINDYICHWFKVRQLGSIGIRNQ